ncbi:phosphotransferase family protein [Streptomyces hiroshimensis]
MFKGEGEAAVRAVIDDRGWSRTRRWVEQSLPPGDRIRAVTALRGGWTSEMRRLDVGATRRPEGTREPYSLVLRSFTKPFYVKHARGLLTREADILRLLSGAGLVPTARLQAVDAAAEHCDHPSLVMSLLPGSVRLDEQDVERKSALLARQLVAVHGVSVAEADRPRTYEAWTGPERVRIPEGTERPELWRRAVDVIRRPAPAYRPCFLHRDFHPGNVLFTGHGPDLAISGVVDWVETSWGPADLDVAHCSTATALLHGVQAGMQVAVHYAAAGGALSDDPAAHLYWRLLDALAFAPDAEKVAVPWRELGRSDLTPAVLTQRLEDYLQALFDQYA